MNPESIEHVVVRLPADLVRRAENQWDTLTDTPDLRVARPRKTAALAVRLLMRWALERLEITSGEITPKTAEKSGGGSINGTGLG